MAFSLCTSAAVLVVMVAAVAVLAVAASDESCKPGFSTCYSSGYDHRIQQTQARIQAQAPAFSAPAVRDGKISTLSLAEFKGKYVVLVFYPLDFTFVCPTELTAFNDRLAEFEAIDTAVVALSVDSVYTHLAWTQLARAEGGLGPMKMPLVSDLTHSIARDYGVLLESGHSLRGLFIIDRKGVLRQITMNDLPVGRSVDETLRLVQAFQFTDAHGEVCPANWTPGSATITPTPDDKLAYFKQAAKKH